MFAAQAVTSLLYERDAKGTGTGGVIDAYLYGSVLRIMEWTIAAYDHLGSVRPRTGNRSNNAAPLDNFQSRDGRYVCIVAVRQAVFERLCEAMGQPELLADDRFTTPKARRLNRDVVNQTVAEWASGARRGHHRRALPWPRRARQRHLRRGGCGCRRPGAGPRRCLHR